MRKLLIAVAAVGLMATACGKSDKPAVVSSTTASTAASTTTTPADQLKVASDAKLGTILVDGQGRTVYRNTKEANGTIACTGQCATNWPPLLRGDGPTVINPGVTGKLGTIKRPEGTLQVTYNGLPLYHWMGDKKPGDTSGQGVGGIWFVVAPSDKAGTSRTTTTTSSSSSTSR